MPLIEILVAIIVLSILVFIHELGHFSVAKKLGIGVEEFGLGLPPRLWGKKVGETIYSVNWLPFGGFVKLTGEDPEDESNPKDKAALKKHFWARSKKERAAVLLAGVTMNFLLAVLIISYIFTQGVFVPTEQVHVEKVQENSPAALAGIQDGDVIVSLDGQSITKTETLISLTKEKAGETLPLVVRRGEATLTLTLTPRKDPPPDEGPLGVVISNLEERKYPWYQAPFYGLIEAFRMSYLMLALLGDLVWRLVTFQPIGGDTVAGPIRIIEEVGKASQQGIMSVLNIMGLLSLNLAIFNLLPIPALDGGRLLFVVLEKFIGHKVRPRIELMAHQLGMVFFISLLVLVTINDLLRKFNG